MIDYFAAVPVGFLITEQPAEPRIVNAADGSAIDGYSHLLFH